ncbi:hypothetical protein BFC22_06845 [Carnobacterium divergens]|uniref:hypothetical protein n=1 Tax=Carnobacterium divergens TaxID=2748 RepID=UPI000E71BC80|nr:hypothetical protein [Carnobacterium divergens]ANZ99831.1 hypothetical protein BFC22_06845 [Carnobacterium divergens]MDT2010679.1 hypothetical protein [Carnobacterium divergens]
MDSVVIAAFIALVGVIISVIGTSIASYYNNKILNEKTLLVQKEISSKSIDANLKSKARIEWIQNVRELIAEMIILCTKYQSKGYKTTLLLNELIVEIEMEDHGYSSSNAVSKIQREIDKYCVDLDILGHGIIGTAIQIELYFSDNEEHKSILQALNKLTLLVNDHKRYIVSHENEKAKQTVECIPTQQRILIDLVKSYLKIEWDKAKSAK